MRKLKKVIALLLIIVILASVINVIIINNESEAVTMSSSYTQYVKSGISEFPESYQTYLNELAELHPNWTFKAYYTGIDWSQVTSTSAENKCLKNTIYYKSGTTLIEPEGLCVCNQTGDTNYYCASSSTVNYYLDPRNFLSEATIFQFLDLSYDSNITKSVLQTAVKNSFLNGSFTVDGKTYTYVDVILEAAEESQVSALHIVVTIFQELGKGTLQSDGTYSLPTAVSGTYSGYEGVYNFFNYGATDGSGAVARGLAKAKELGWTDQITAIKEGVQKVLANSYISAGQNTKYFYKFDVVGNEILTESMGKKTYSSSYFFSHQYMTNIQDPLSQASSLFTYYTNTGLLSNSLTFVIPVYNNMPSAPVTKGTSLTSSDGTLYYVTAATNVNVRSGAGTSYSSYGSVYRGTIVAVTSTSNSSWYKVKFYKATSYNSSSKTWKYSTVTGYISSSYLAKVSSLSSTSSISLDATDKVLTAVPNATVSSITSTYSGATVKNASGTTISSSSTKLATGYTVTIDGTSYTIIKYGDINGDGYVDTGDTFIAKQVVMGVKSVSGIYFTAADVNKDGYIDTGDTFILKKQILGIESIGL